MSDHTRDGRPHLEVVPPPEDAHEPTPPNDPYAERAVIGAMLHDRQTVLEVTQVVNPEHFYHPRHELIYAAITRRLGRLDPIDVGLIADDLRKTGDLNRCGGSTYLHELHAAGIAVPTDAALHYADIVREHAAHRRLVQAGTRIIQMGYAQGEGNIDDLYTRAAAELDRDTILQPIPGLDDTTTHPWAPVDIAELLDNHHEAPTATIGRRRDGQGLLYPGAIHSVSGEPGGGKTWLAQIIAAQELDHGNNVAIIDFEDRGQTHTTRLQALGVPQDTLRAGHLRYIRPHVALDPAGWTHLEHATHDCTLVVVDGITEAMTLHGLSLMDNEDAARWIALLPRRVADLGPAVLQVDHVVKNSENRGRYAIGAQHKLAALDGVAYKLITVRSFGKGNHGQARLVIDKDRHGDVGPNGFTAADVHLDATSPDGTFGWIDTPLASHDEDGNFRPTVLMKRVSDYLAGAPSAASLSDIKRGVRGNAASIADAVDALVREGYLRVTKGPRNADLHHLVTAFEEDQ